MPENTLHLSDKYSIPVTQYASQGNAILGIRDSGKSYSAMKMAEELLTNGIPIIAFDPVGIWKNLKIGVDGNKGFEVVVAGGYQPDIPLTVDNAADIIRAAMKENVSVIIDLFSPQLSKSNWIRIVQETVDILFYENIEYGLRHIFIEEAAEFIPQRVQPQQGKVYASLERLARMGRNSRLGYTLINQRAEEVNKAVLELCEFSLLHKQVGKNSLNSLKKWMDLLQVGNEKDILSSLPNLKKGECWVIGQNQQPKRIQVAKKKTFHPNPQKPGEVPINTQPVNVALFVEQIKKALNGKEVHLEKTSVTIPKEDPEKELLKQKVDAQSKYIYFLEQKLNTIRQTCIEPYHQINTPSEIKAVAPKEQRPSYNKSSTPSSLPIGEKKILTACAQYPKGLKRDQLTVLTGYKRSSRDAYIQRLKEKKFLEQQEDRLFVTTEGKNELGADFEPLPTGHQLQEFWLSRLPKGEASILEILIKKYPHSVKRDTLTLATGYQRSSRDAYIQRMAAKEVVSIVDRGEVKAADTLFNI